MSQPDYLLLFDAFYNDTVYPVEYNDYTFSEQLWIEQSESFPLQRHIDNLKNDKA